MWFGFFLNLNFDVSLIYHTVIIFNYIKYYFLLFCIILFYFMEFYFILFLSIFYLFFVGSNKAPIGGLKNLGLKIHRMGPDSLNLPTAHTCFNALLLPEYNTKEKTKNCLLKAINECEGFGLK